MRLLIYSDIHANGPALDALAAATVGRYDHAACLGDIVGYGGAPNRVADWVRAHAEIVVRGNHDRAAAALDGVDAFNATAAAAARWTHAALQPELRDWLAALPAGPLAWRGMLLAHGSPLDEDTYITDPAAASAALLAPPALTYRLLWVGHTHWPLVYAEHEGVTEPLPLAFPPGRQDESAQWAFTLEPDRRYLVNPGSVGQPRNRDRRASFAIFDDEQARLTFYRVPYDVTAAQAEIQRAGLPLSLAARLELGR